MNASSARRWPTRSCEGVMHPQQVTNNGQWCKYMVACWQSLNSHMVSGFSTNASWLFSVKATHLTPSKHGLVSLLEEPLQL